jgi:ribosome assembly protein RRB1
MNLDGGNQSSGGGAKGSAKDDTVGVWNPMDRPLQDDETLDYDSSAYTMYHSLKTEWPCLSVAVIKDNLGASRTSFPMTSYLCAGTQADKHENNKLTVMKISDMCKTSRDEEDSDADSDDEALDMDPVMQTRSVAHPGACNRVRVMPQKPSVVATWAETGKVHVWDISAALQQLDGHTGGADLRRDPVHTISCHTTEGYALDWSLKTPGRLLSGDCASKIHLSEPLQGGTWVTSQQPFTAHDDSVEDLQWSATEEHVFASCSVDKTIRIWDSRRALKHGAMISVEAHETDVNVISWNRMVSYLMVSGADDGSFKIWDLRNFKADQPAAHFRWHKAPISSVAWHSEDDAMLAVASADNSISIWDMSVEADDSGEIQFGESRMKVPPQLMFLHQGQRDPKEVTFHPQNTGVLVSTAADGINIFKPSNL